MDRCRAAGAPSSIASLAGTCSSWRPRPRFATTRTLEACCVDGVGSRLMLGSHRACWCARAEFRNELSRECVCVGIATLRTRAVDVTSAESDTLRAPWGLSFALLRYGGQAFSSWHSLHAALHGSVRQLLHPTHCTFS